MVHTGHREPHNFQDENLVAETSNPLRGHHRYGRRWSRCRTGNVLRATCSVTATDSAASSLSLSTDALDTLIAYA